MCIRDRLKLEAFWDWLADKADNMDVLMGDFNMSLFLVVHELRSRGVTIDLAAWFPWKLPGCTPMVGSCAIFFINRPGIYQLVKGRHCLHAHNQKGIYWDAASHQAAVAAGDPSGTGDFQVMGEEGPGFPFATFMPKDDLVYPCVKETLSPSKSQEELDELSKRGLLWRTREKRLGMDYFLFEHANHVGIIQGAHYPLCAFTNNKCRRSEKANEKRRDRAVAAGRTTGNHSRNDWQGSRQDVDGQGSRQDESRSRGWRSEGQSSCQNEGPGRWQNEYSWCKDDWKAGWQDESHSRGWWKDVDWQGSRQDESLSLIHI